MYSPDPAASVPPLVSVVIPVRDGADTIVAALQSLICQKYKNFEVIVVDDGSVDGTADVVNSLPDPRITLVANVSESGISGALRTGIAASKGEYLARMDADDRAYPLRLDRQVAFMSKNPDVGVLGTSAVMVGPGRARLRIMPRSSDAVVSELFFRSSLIHPTVMFRVSAIPCWYDPRLRNAEDYDLWTRLALAGVRFANLRRPLLWYRLPSRAEGASKSELRRSEGEQAQMKFLAAVLPSMSEKESRAMGAMGRRASAEPELLVSGLQVVLRLAASKEACSIVGRRALRRRIAFEASIFCWANAAVLPQALKDLGFPTSLGVLSVFLRSPIAVVHALTQQGIRGLALRVRRG